MQDAYLQGRELHELKEVAKKSREQGMISFDQSALRAGHERKQDPTYETPLRNAGLSLGDLRLPIKLHNKRGGANRPVCRR
ncbi:hypothetical protein ACU4HD_46590 [Cupriavidus basilensis]